MAEKRDGPLSPEEIWNVGPLLRKVNYKEDLLIEVANFYARSEFNHEEAYREDPTGHYPLPVVVANLDAYYRKVGYTKSELQARIDETVKAGLLEKEVVGPAKKEFIRFPRETDAVRVKPSHRDVLGYVWSQVPDYPNVRMFLSSSLELAQASGARFTKNQLLSPINIGGETGLLHRPGRGQVGRGQKWRIAVYPKPAYIGGVEYDLRELAEEYTKLSSDQTSGAQVLNYLRTSLAQLPRSVAAELAEVETARAQLHEIRQYAAVYGEEATEAFCQTAQAELDAKLQQARDIEILRESLKVWEKYLLQS